MKLTNSKWNLESFLGNMNLHLKIIPDFRPKQKTLEQKIRVKSIVTYFPISKVSLDDSEMKRPTSGPIHIVWAHRWEHDKNPKLLFSVLSLVFV